MLAVSVCQSLLGLACSVGFAGFDLRGRVCRSSLLGQIYWVRFTGWICWCGFAVLSLLRHISFGMDLGRVMLAGASFLGQVYFLNKV